VSSGPTGVDALEMLPAAGGFALRGSLTIGQVGPWRDRGRSALAAMAGEPLRIDLVGLTRVDSAGLALLVDWLAWARAARRNITFDAMPPPLHALARLSGLEGLLARQPGAQPPG
jgi:phospholipid transport system transporter-binding protein